MQHSGYALAVIALLLGAGCSQSDSTVGGSGLIETNEVLVSAEAAGRVTKLFFDEGTKAGAGDTLAVIDPGRLELRLAALVEAQSVTAASLNTATIKVEQTRRTETYAESEYSRVSRLLKSGTATQRQHDQLQHEFTQAVLGRRLAEAHVAMIEAERRKADAEIERVERELRDCYPLAPIAGTITQKYVETGELLNIGMPIAEIAPLDTVWVKVYLPAGDFANVRLGSHANVSTESGGGEYDGVVVWTSQEAEFTPKNVQTRESRTGLVYAVKVRIPNVNGSLKIGMPVFVTLAEL